MLGNSERKRLACILSIDKFSTILGATPMQEMEDPSVDYKMQHGTPVKAFQKLYAVYWGLTTTGRIWRLSKDYTDREFVILEECYLLLSVFAFGFVDISIHAVILNQDDHEFTIQYAPIETWKVERT